MASRVDDGTDVGGEVEGVADVERLARRPPACRSSPSPRPPARRTGAPPSSAGPPSSKAERTTSRITCSGSALESAIMALRPPVSAMKGTMAPRRSASARWMAQPVALEPVKATPATRGSLTRAAPTAPAPGSRCRTPGGTPASCSSWTARKAVIGVCSAGLASTGLPAASAAATWPVKMASGKFHGDMQANGPRPRSSSRLVSPVGPLSETGPPNCRRACARSSAGSRLPRARRPARSPASCRPRAP